MFLYELETEVSQMEDKIETTIVHNKNLADEAVFELGLTINSSAKITPNTNAGIIKFPCKPSTTYTISKIVTTHFRVANFLTDPINGVQGDGMITDNSASSITITADADSTYLAMYVYNSSDTTQTIEQIMASLQIEVGTEATTYVAPGWNAIDDTARVEIATLRETEQNDKGELNAKIDERTFKRIDNWKNWKELVDEFGFIRPNYTDGDNT